MLAAEAQKWDFGALRGLSAATLALFNLRVERDGWTWQTKTAGGAVATRWKSFHSQRPAGDETWAKYRWLPEKPADAKYFCPPKCNLTEAVDDGFGTLYMVGGEVAAMTMIEAGWKNTTCTFGDSAIPDTLLDDLKRWRVQTLHLIPDRDESGQRWACAIRDALSAQLDVKLIVSALPYDLEKSHGKDVNDFWLDSPRDPGGFNSMLFNLSHWRLPEAQVQDTRWTPPEGDTVGLPARFLEAVERALDVRGDYNSDGWSLKHVRCPFHDDATPSANWNRTLSILRCHSTCGQSYLAKEVGERFGIHLRDYLDSTPLIPKTQVLTVVPKTAPDGQPPAAVRHTPERKLRPALPAFAQLSEEQEQLAASGREWLDDYLAWTKQSCPLAPEIFHEAMALWLLATISTRRMKLVIGGQEIYPNLYLLVIAKTSLYRKSTAMNEAKKILKLAGLECLLLPTDVTPEALFDELAGVKPSNFDSLPLDERRDWLLGRAVSAQRAFLKDECSSIFANLRKDYNAGLTELLLEGYQGDGGKLKKLLKSKGLITVKDMCLSFLGATTPVMYAKYISNEETENGFIARFAIITPEGMPVYEVHDDPVMVPTALVTRLRHLFLDVLPWHGEGRPSASAAIGDALTPPVVSIGASQDALRQLGEYRKALNYDMLVAEAVDDSKAAAYTRLATMAVKVAMLLAAIDSRTGYIRIEPQHAYAAQQICERWRESLHRLDRDVARSAESGSDKVLNYLKTCGTAGATLREIMRDCAVKQRGYAEDMLRVLHEDGSIEKYDYKPEGGGRPSVRFRFLQK